MILTILAVSMVLQVSNERQKALDDSRAVFGQIQQILAENEAELAEIKEEYTRTCFYNATAISRLIQADPSVLDSVDALREIAEFTEVDEIHIFDKTGTIFTGTHPQYYNYSFDSGEQMMFFKPMLTDKSLKLVQDITPNTAEHKLMQYSAVWSEDGEFIVQIGMEPINVMKAAKKNELSYIFSLLRVNTGVKLYAVDKESGVIVGSNLPDENGRTLEDIGIDMDKALNESSGFHAVVNGEDCFCVFIQTDNNLIGRIIPNDELFSYLFQNILELAAGLVIIAVILVVTVSGFTDKYVISNIYDVNEKLGAITNGNLDETVDIQSSIEFSELSSHINEMVRTLLANTDKLSYVLNKTELHIGVYEYNSNMQGVRVTEYLPQILGIIGEEKLKVFSDHKRFKEFIDELRRRPIGDTENVFSVNEKGQHFVKLDEVTRGNDILGIVIDVTDEVMAMRRIEEERDIDLLTGLYNRRGLDNKLKELFSDPKNIENGALIMIDSDGLKSINDRYGHEMGDVYLKKISGIISSFEKGRFIAARQGGDEFVVFMYRYSSEREILDNIDELKFMQNNCTAQLSPEISVPLRFSFGYSLTRGRTNYSELLKAADDKMYESKRERKKEAMQLL